MHVVKILYARWCFFILFSLIPCLLFSNTIAQGVNADCDDFASNSEMDVLVLASIGDIVSLPCTVNSASENLQVTWLWNDVNISLNNKIVVSESRYSLSLSTLLYDFTLRIEQATFLDNGDYECQLDSDVIKSYTLCVANGTISDVSTESPTTKNLTPIRNAHKAILLICLIIVMFGSGFGIATEKDWKDIFYPYELLLYIFCQFGMMPLIGFILAHIFSLEKSAALGALIVACCPGMVTSTLFLHWIGIKDTFISVTMIVVSVIGSSVMIPLWLFVYSRSWIVAQDLPYGYIFLTVLLCLAIPLALGVIIGKKTTEWYTGIVIHVCSGLGALGIVISLILQAVEKNEVFYSWNLWLLTAIFPFLGFLLGYLIPCCFFLGQDLKFTFSLELGFQNVLLTLVFFAFLPFSQDLDTVEMMSVPGLYGVFMLIEGFLFFLLYNITQSKHQKIARRKRANAKRTPEVYTLPVDITASQNLSTGTGLSHSTLIYYENYGFSDTTSTNRSIDTRRMPLSGAPVVSFDDIREGDISVKSGQASGSYSYHEGEVIDNRYIDDIDNRYIDDTDNKYMDDTDNRYRPYNDADNRYMDDTDNRYRPNNDIGNRYRHDTDNRYMGDISNRYIDDQYDEML